MELAPRIHEGHSEGRTVPGSRANGTLSWQEVQEQLRLFQNCFLPACRRMGKYMSEPVSKCWCKHFLGTYCGLCIVHFHKQEDVKKQFEMKHELKCLQGLGR